MNLNATEPSNGRAAPATPLGGPAQAAGALGGCGPHERMHTLMEATASATGALGRATGEIARVRGLVEVLRAAAGTKAPTQDTRDGIETLADVIGERMRRIRSVLQGAIGEWEATKPGRTGPDGAMGDPGSPGDRLSISGDGSLSYRQAPTPGARADASLIGEAARSPCHRSATDAFTRCYRRAYEALTKPDETARLIDDPVMSKYLAEGGVQQKGELYDVVASLVRVLDGKDVDSAAARNALIRGFKKRAWPWPTSFDGLRRHLLAHPPPASS